MFAAIVDARDTDGNWLYSFRHIPKRMVTWRPEFNFMNQVPNVNSLESKHFDFQRHIFKPRMTQSPYADSALRDNAVDDLEDVF